MSNYACLERYIPLVEFMGKICGKNYEIILHDVSTPERSVIAACNEHLSGRRIGDLTACFIRFIKPFKHLIYIYFFHMTYLIFYLYPDVVFNFFQ